MTKTFDLILRNGTLLVPVAGNKSLHPKDFLREEKMDIAITGKKIVGLGQFSQQQADQVIDCEGLHILPGLIDTQVHFREPGMTHKEDIESGSRAALLGGITGFFEMPNTKPSTTTREALLDKFNLAANRSHVHYAFYSGAEPGNISALADLETMESSPGIKVFLGLSTGTLLIKTDEQLAAILAGTKSRIVFHAEDDQILNEREKYIVPGQVTSHYKWRDETSALQATRRIVETAERLGRRVHILHVTTEEEMNFLREHKKTATVEVLPQHLYLSAPEDYERLGSLVQQNPPIREARHRAALRKALREGVVDMVASDHAPHTREEKDKPYPQSPSGMPGVQTLLPLMLNLVNEGVISLPHMTALMSESPRRIFAIQNKARIEVGFDADLTVVDMNKKTTIQTEWLASKSKWSPFVGMQVRGWPQGVILNGRMTMWDDEIVLPHSGQALAFDKTVSI